MEIEQSPRPRRPTLLLLAALLPGAAVTLASTFAAERWTFATYPDVMGCEIACRVVGTGWPLLFVRDYTGMSVVGTADIVEVLLAGDRFDWLPFTVDVAFWTALLLLLLALARRARRAWAGTRVRPPRSPA